MKKKILNKENFIIILLLVLSTLISSMFIFNEKIYNGEDLTYHLSRIIGITNNWKAGNFLSYIHLDETGYGYAIGFFYSNLFIIFPSVLYMLGINMITIYRIFILVCGFTTSLSMYICMRSMTKEKYPALISSVLYTTCAYRIITLLAKSYTGEILSFIFVPIIILGLFKLIFEDEKKWWIFTIGFVGILNSNLVITEIMIIISAIFVLCNIVKICKNKSRLIGFIKATILALLISAIFWMPLVEQLINSTFMLKPYMWVYRASKWLLKFSSMFFGTIQYERNTDAAYGLGFIFIIILVLRLRIKEKNTLTKFCDISILSGLTMLLCMTNFFPWKKLGKISGIIQFPSRMEIPVAAFFSIACGIICWYISDKKILKQKIFFSVVFVWQIIASIIYKW